MTEERAATFRSRLEEMQQDLVAMTHELNKSGHWDAALRMQQLLMGIDHATGADVDLDDPDDCRWPPEVLPMGDTPVEQVMGDLAAGNIIEEQS